MSSWHIRPKGVKNPLNPVIGEVHSCFWNFGDECVSHYVAEQLSHHPPHTAFVYYNIARGVAVNANLAPSYAKYYGNSAESKMTGKIVVNLTGKHGAETYTLDYPDFLVKGILFGTLMMEITGKVTIKNSSDLFCEIEFKQKVTQMVILFHSNFCLFSTGNVYWGIQCHSRKNQKKNREIELNRPLLN